MPPPMRNPNWTPTNGQPQWIAYGAPNPNYVPQSQGNTVVSAPGPRARRATVARIGVANNSGNLSNAAGPSNAGDYRVGVQPIAAITYNTGAPNHASSMRNSIGYTNTPGIPATTAGPVNAVQVVPASTVVPANAPSAANSGAHTQPQAQNTRGPQLATQPTAQPQVVTQASRPAGRPNTGGTAPRPASAIPPAKAIRLTRDVVSDVGKLLKSNRKSYGGHIKNFQELALHESAEKWLRRKGAGEGDLCADMPQDDARKGVLAQRLFSAIENLQGIESRAGRITRDRNGHARAMESTGVKCVKGKNGYRREVLAWKFMVSVLPTFACFVLGFSPPEANGYPQRAIKEAQKGELELDDKFKFKKFGSFMARFRALEASLRVSVSPLQLSARYLHREREKRS